MHGGNPKFLVLVEIDLPGIFEEAHKFFHDKREDETMTMMEFSTTKTLHWSWIYVRSKSVLLERRSV